MSSHHPTASPALHLLVQRSSLPGPVLGTTQVEVKDRVVDLAPPWPRLELGRAIADRVGVDPIALGRDPEPLRELMRERGVDASKDKTWAQLVDHLVSHFVEPELVAPTFLVDYPVELSPLARRKPGAGKEGPHVADGKALIGQDQGLIGQIGQRQRPAASTTGLDDFPRGDHAPDREPHGLVVHTGSVRRVVDERQVGGPPGREEGLDDGARRDGCEGFHAATIRCIVT